MLATVKFITTGATELLTWDCPVGRAYLAATQDANPMLALAMGLYEDAARSNWKEPADAWRDLQNIEIGWKELNADSIECLTNRPRSMMKGDIIVFEDGRCFICESYGWGDLNEFEKKGWIES